MVTAWVAENRGSAQEDMQPRTRERRGIPEFYRIHEHRNILPRIHPPTCPVHWAIPTLRALVRIPAACDAQQTGHQAAVLN